MLYADSTSQYSTVQYSTVQYVTYSTLAWSHDQGSYETRGAILPKDVCQFMAVGVTTQYILNGHPKRHIGSEKVNLIAVHSNQTDKMILFGSCVPIKMN